MSHAGSMTFLVENDRIRGDFCSLSVLFKIMKDGFTLRSHKLRAACGNYISITTKSMITSFFSFDHLSVTNGFSLFRVEK